MTRTTRIDLFLRCVPPSTTAQMKRVHVLHGKPVFFHGAKMRREASACEIAARRLSQGTLAEMFA